MCSSDLLSTALALQMIGRGLRPSPDTGQVDLRIHDHAGVTLMHGRPDDDRDFTLGMDAPRVEPATRAATVTSCRQCAAILERTERVCWMCGAPTRRGRTGPRAVPARAEIPFGDA